jgi:hypothetical protein
VASFEIQLQLRLLDLKWRRNVGVAQLSVLHEFEVKNTLLIGRCAPVNSM